MNLLLYKLLLRIVVSLGLSSWLVLVVVVIVVRSMVTLLHVLIMTLHQRHALITEMMLVFELVGFHQT